MRTEAGSIGGASSIVVGSGALVGLLAGAAMASSAIVFSEPAPVDVLMAGLVVAVPLLGVGHVGRLTWFNLGLWLAIVALGLLATAYSTTFGTAVQHQVVTLFLTLGSVSLAAYIAADPEPRSRLVLNWYTVGCVVAVVAGIAGYFRVVPGAYDLFTNYGRARGTFKDPNVFGAAIAPALVYAAWLVLRARGVIAKIAAGVGLLMIFGLLISFSRGAWLSAGVSLLLLGWVLLVRSRRQTDFNRFRLVSTIGIAAIVASVFALTQIEQVRSLLTERASFDQSYDYGPDGRFGGQDKARKLIADNPLGIGTHTFRDVLHHEEAHNVYLTMFLNAGWIGGVLYIASVLATLIVGFRACFRNSVLQGPLLVVTTAFAGVAFEGYVIDSDHWRSFFILLGCVWGLADAPDPDVDPSRRRDDEVPR